MDEDQVELEEADRRAEKAKASLRSRFHELERRYEETKDRLDLGARIANHPRASVGIALGAGLLLGLLRGGRRPAASVVDGETQRTLGSTVVAALGALAIQALKEAAFDEGKQMATKWWADRTTRDADPLEPILEH